MLKSATSAIALSVVFLASQASAADLRGSTKDTPSSYAPESNTHWAGPYIGVHGGWSQWEFGRPDDDHLAPSKQSPTQEIEGGFGGAQFGYDIHVPGSQIVIGAVADVSVGDLDGGTYKDGSAITVDSQIDAFGTVRGRLGYSFGRVLPYVTGGAAWVVGSTSEHCPKGPTYSTHCNTKGQYDETDDFARWGFAYGVGVEAKVTSNVTAFAEYLRLDFGQEVHDLGPKSSDRVEELSEIDVIKAGLNYRF